jgi:methionine sulfoxide reductase heme-binding subunit
MKIAPSLFDKIVLAGSIIILLAVGFFVFAENIFADLVTADQSLTWYLVRASGISAYILVTGCTVWGILLSTKVIRDWSPGPLSILIHSTTAWLSVAFMLIHMVLLLFDKFFKYQVYDLLIPFIGPYRPFAVGLGVIAFWIILVVNVSLTVNRKLAHYRITLLNYGVYLSFVLATVHSYLAGTDAIYPGFQLMLVANMAVVLIALGFRLGKSNALEKPAPARERPARTAKTVRTPASEFTDDAEPEFLEPDKTTD